MPNDTTTEKTGASENGYNPDGHGLPCPLAGPQGVAKGRNANALQAHLVQLSIFSFPTTRRSNLLINSVLCASAACMAVVVCFKVLMFDPKTTAPPITAAIVPIITVGSNPTAPMIAAKIKVPPAARNPDRCHRNDATRDDQKKGQPVAACQADDLLVDRQHHFWNRVQARAGSVIEIASSIVTFYNARGSHGVRGWLPLFYHSAVA
jgi:hypothetical protein